MLHYADNMYVDYKFAYTILHIVQCICCLRGRAWGKTNPTEKHSDLAASWADIWIVLASNYRNERGQQQTITILSSNYDVGKKT